MEDELYLDNIDEFVTDQNRVVTYKWLSYTLGVHVNQAKQMLYDYVERKRKENSGAQLHVTYLVAGNLVQNGYICHKVAVVREDKLEAVKSKLATIASVHVYSIQKALLKDSGPLYNTDYDIIKTNLQNCSKFSAIHCAAAVPRTLAEVSQAHTSAQIDSQAPNDMQVASMPVTNGHVPSTGKQTSQQPKGIMGMFAAKSSSKSQDTHKETKPESKETTGVSTASSKPPAKGNTMSNFFGKAAMNKLKASSESEQAKEEKEVTKPSVPAAEPKLPPATTVDKPGKKTEPVKIQKKDRKSRAKRVDLSDNEEEKEAENLKKKRRRIKQPQSDSSDNEDGPASSISQEDRAPTPSPEPPPKAGLEPASTEVKASTGGKKRKRRRVLKSKTFLDDEGCMVTEKVYESESCTDSEEEFSKAKPAALHRQSTVPVKKDPKEDQRGPKKGATTASKANKQVSIMGFFQKK
ncbi:PREDICTED: DNA polymerase delta subunit 3 isoform X2 [Gavialis gangeticus]|uniref:DNA polymerase delta subunit 3 isoform X2 n=1 Tax=Gavialis gangeticus TaxID=94835 RepID=UPI00092EA695|nr:PREDICTED: DNA polymerase delta subunit 3 isoform X2 [Gavialis gangeticus]